MTGLASWPREHRLLFWGIAVPAVLAVFTGIVVPIVSSGGPPRSSVNVHTNNGQMNFGGTVNNYYDDNDWKLPGVDQKASCPVASSAKSQPARELTINLQVRLHREGECWARSLDLGLTPARVQYLISYFNTSNKLQRDVVVGVRLAPGLALIPGTTYLANEGNPEGVLSSSDAIASNGIVIGSYYPGANAYVVFEVSTPSITDLQCGNDKLRTVASVQPKSLNYYYNTADVDLAHTCPAPSPS